MINVLLFLSDHCQYCPIVERYVKELALKYNYPVRVIKKENEIEIFEKFNIVGVPTIILLYNDKIVFSNFGYLYANKLDKEFIKWSF